jgi:hypothetical protein
MARSARELFDSLPDVLGRDTPEQREALIWDEIERGHYPAFTRLFAPVVLSDERGRSATFQVSVDCFAVGTDDDWLRVALSGYYAQRIADFFACCLPTNKLVFETYRQAKIRLVAHLLECQAVGGGRWQRSTFACRLHEDILQGRIPCKKGHPVVEAAGRMDPRLGGHEGLCALPPGRHPGVLVAGHLKEVTLSGVDLSKKLGFAGFFLANGKALQSGAHLPHGPGFADYSHGVRLVARKVELGGQVVDYEDLVTDPAYAGLVFQQGGPCSRPARYPAPPAKFFMGG